VFFYFTVILPIPVFAYYLYSVFFSLYAGGGHPGIVGPGTGLPGGGPQGQPGIMGTGAPGCDIFTGPGDFNPSGTGLPGHPGPTGPQGQTGGGTDGPADFGSRRFRRQLSVGSPDRPCYTGTIRYDTKCYFNVRSKADMSQLNLPHGTNN